jgi:2-C-methyl-D-erythritol 4-phosphate cytidylyltransferase
MDKHNSVAGIIVAAGKGLRMGGEKKKQYMLLGSLPVLCHTLLSFDRCHAVDEIFLIIPEEDRAFCQREIVDKEERQKPINLVSGGTSRQESVLNGLKATEGHFQYVAIHDGVRPLVKPETITECIVEAKKHGACILAVPTRDTVKTVGRKTHTVETTLKRDTVWMVQTPQVFRYEDILEAHVLAQKNCYMGTDDAELLEKRGGIVKVIEGDPYNIKITTPKDLQMAQLLLSFA